VFNRGSAADCGLTKKGLTISPYGKAESPDGKEKKYFSIFSEQMKSCPASTNRKKVQAERTAGGRVPKGESYREIYCFLIRDRETRSLGSPPAQGERAICHHNREKEQSKNSSRADDGLPFTRP